MKKINLLIILILILSLILSACSKKNDENKDSAIVNNQTQNQEEKQDDETANVDKESDENVMKMPSFTLKTIDGDEISSDIFGDYDLTIISIWQST
ncbi:MAG TPA: hypothetical protein VIK77_08825 [Tissierellaceae bacterium]